MTRSAGGRLFVYGSLKRGQVNHRLLSGAPCLGVAQTARAFALIEQGGYLALVPGERAIAGELYELSAERLRALDEFEGEAYERRAIALADGTLAHAYLARAPDAGAPLPCSASQAGEKPP